MQGAEISQEIESLYQEFRQEPLEPTMTVLEFSSVSFNIIFDINVKFFKILHAIHVQSMEDDFLIVSGN